MPQVNPKMGPNRAFEIEKSIREFCKPRLVDDTPIRLMTTADRWALGECTAAGPHDGGMAMWSQPFSGGSCLAQYILAHKEKFSGKAIVDIGSGSGVVAIAAAMAGGKVTAVDTSPYAEHVIPINAAMNGVTVDFIRRNALDDAAIPYSKADIVTVADVFYVNRDRDELVKMLLVLAREHKTIYASSQDKDLSELFAPLGVTPKVLMTGLVNSVSFDASDCRAPAPTSQKQNAGFTP